MARNVVIVDVDVDFKKLVRRINNPSGGYVSLEYYYEVDDGTFSELERLDTLYSTEDEPTVLGVLDGLKPFDGISTGMASLAKAQLDKNPQVTGHSFKIREVLDALRVSGPVDRILRICHTMNLFRTNAGVLEMYCRSFYVNPETLEQEIANPGPGNPPPPEAKPGHPDADPGDIQALFDFLALRKNFRQTKRRTYRLNVLTPIRDYDMSTVKTVKIGVSFEDAFKSAVEWLNRKRDAGELVYDKNLLRVTATNYGADRKAHQNTDGVIAFLDPRVSGSIAPGSDQTTVALDGKTLPVRKSQPLRIFSIVPALENPYQISESSYIDYLAHMLDDCRW